jgi:multiple sugar transport system substrate-binding protein
LALDLTDFLNASNVIKVNDLFSVADYYKFDGRYYGLPKDWSPDLSLYVDRSAFQAAGIPLPSETEPLTYAELAKLARSLTLKTNGQVTRYGYFLPDYLSSITSVLLQRNTALFNKDFTKMHLTTNPIAMEVLRYFYDMGVDGTLNPNIDSEGDFWGDKMPSAIVQWGYWFGGSLDTTSQNYANLVMLPAPTWDPKLPRIDTSFGPTGLAINTNTKHPKEAYRLLEWYVAGDGSKTRTVQGQGVPILRSTFDLLPKTNAFDKQRYDVLTGELKSANWKFPIYPNDTFNTSWSKNILLAAQGKIDFETFALNIEQDVNLALLNNRAVPQNAG